MLFWYLSAGRFVPRSPSRALLPAVVLGPRADVADDGDVAVHRDRRGHAVGEADVVAQHPLERRAVGAEVALCHRRSIGVFAHSVGHAPSPDVQGGGAVVHRDDDDVLRGVVAIQVGLDLNGIRAVERLVLGRRRRGRRGGLTQGVGYLVGQVLPGRRGPLFRLAAVVRLRHGPHAAVEERAERHHEDEDGRRPLRLVVDLSNRIECFAEKHDMALGKGWG